MNKIQKQLTDLNYEDIATVGKYKVWKFSAKKFGIYSPTGRTFYWTLEEAVYCLAAEVRA